MKKAICFLLLSLVALSSITCLAAGKFKTNSTSKQHVQREFSSFKSTLLCSKTTGWIFEGNKVLRTSDGAKSWIDTSPYLSDINKLNEGNYNITAYFYNSEIAWVALGIFSPAKKLFIYKTINGGRKWTKTAVPIKEDWECTGDCDICFISLKNGFMLINSEPSLGLMNKSIYKSENGGTSWKRINVISRQIEGYPNGIMFTDKMRGWITSVNHGQEYIPVFKTVNGGLSWKKENLKLYSSFKNGYYTNALTPIIFNYEEAVLPIEYIKNDERFIIPYLTNNGGKTWQVETRFKNYKSLCYDYINKKQWWMVDNKNYKLYSTDDGGKHWVQIAQNPLLKNLKSIRFIDPKFSWGISDNYLLKIIIDNKNVSISKTF